ncbi:Bax inhibitor-1/YccA family protein [Pararhodospirillum oryzae]|uniref:Membrane protein n=1 Tax=Pararhodospirillum oryzae TaxID=478448 RepID=A0A512H9W2_9PROT|nr:Bax inhibitor-1/YccA family protein [Pararhodospirillum oryzae]GEO82246.1 membrane protein [Pararhodospirillum oryzae]
MVDISKRVALSQAGMGVDARLDVGLRRYMLRIYNYMASGLLLSGLVAMAVVYTPLKAVFYAFDPATGAFAGLSILGMIAVFAPLVLLFGAMFAAQRMSAAATQAFYWAFVTLQGISLSTLLVVYTGESVVRVFFITAAAFAALSLYGYTTRRDLSALGKFLFMGVVGILIAGLVNMFVESSMLQFVMSAVGVLVFSGLIAYDTQAIKERYVATMGTDEETKVAVFSALALYLNFINLLQFLLMFLGNRE